MDPREPPVTEPRDLRRSVMHQTQYAALVATRAEQLVAGAHTFLRPEVAARVVDPLQRAIAEADAGLLNMFAFAIPDPDAPDWEACPVRLGRPGYGPRHE